MCGPGAPWTLPQGACPTLPPWGGCCVTVHDLSPAHVGGSCHPCQGVSPTLSVFLRLRSIPQVDRHGRASRLGAAWGLCGTGVGMVCHALDSMPCRISPSFRNGSEKFFPIEFESDRVVSSALICV